ncbi:hypothetical protein C1H46_010598 [Malus baccata]|uniref:Uncharacterized protein n=1 Tax=Malus baccata TaxID=106549 RepID=A0A540MYC2_MALBA|nr:hypothetical protein C1H46_010598 [Malus baccata]
MSNLIRSCKAVTIAPCSIPPPPTSAANALAKMDHRQLIRLVPRSASLVAPPVSARCGHHRLCMPDTTSASTNDASGSQQEIYMGTLSPVEDDEGHPGDQQTYHDRIRRRESGYTNSIAA